MQALTTRRAAILCLALALSAYCYAQNLTIGNALPCFDDNLNCLLGEACYNRSMLCDGVGFCPGFAEDEGFINALDCTGTFGLAERYRCNVGTDVLTLDLLCDGIADCMLGGDDETNPLCANKCRLPFYGGCSYTRQCANSVFSATCGACLSGLFDIGEPDCVRWQDIQQAMQQDMDRQGHPQNWRQPSTPSISQDWWPPRPDYLPRPHPMAIQPSGAPNAELQENAECTCKEEIQHAQDQIDTIKEVLKLLPCTRTGETQCKALDDPDNGDVFQTGTTYRSTATYICNVGSELVGENTRTCEANGEWSGTAPHCRTKLADLHMSRPGEQCPDGLTLITSPRRLCLKTTSGFGCDSVIYSTNNIQYTTVCGKVIGLGINSPDAFEKFPSVCTGFCETVEGPYVDGVSITHGRPREHIWSFAVQHPGRVRCPCSTGSTFTTPSFVGDDYTCETYTPADPVWDGQGCIEEDRLCCQRTSVPLFCKELPEPTTDDIEVRLCTDQTEGDENVAVESIELYIQ